MHFWDDNTPVIVIPDIHQDIGFLRAIINRHPNARFVFLGDYFDAGKPKGLSPAGMKATCLEVNRLFTELGDRALWLFGNHDFGYLSTYRPGAYTVRRGSAFTCSGWTRSKAKKFNKAISPEWVANLKLTVKVGRFQLSHAGFHTRYFRAYHSLEENVTRLSTEWEQDRPGIFLKAQHWLNEIGHSREGNYPVGSPIWLDWEAEFEPIRGFPQIVGHSNNAVTPFRELEGNFCIDGRQTCYGYLHRGNFEPRFIYESC